MLHNTRYKYNLCLPLFNRVILWPVTFVFKLRKRFTVFIKCLFVVYLRIGRNFVSLNLVRGFLKYQTWEIKRNVIEKKPLYQ